MAVPKKKESTKARLARKKRELRNSLASDKGVPTVGPGKVILQRSKKVQERLRREIRALEKSLI